MTRPARLTAMLAALSVAAPAGAYAQAPDAQAPGPQAPGQQPPTDQTPTGQTPGPQVGGSPGPGPGPLETRTQVYYHAGSWDAFSGRGASGGPVCGVGSTDPATRHVLSLRFDIGGEDTTFSAGKPGWSIPDGTQLAVVMQVGLDAPWTLRATGRGQSVQWTLDRDAIQTFDRQFRDAAQMTLSFPDGNEPPWTVSLAGSTAVSDTFGRCITDLTRQVQDTRPPQGDAAPQPSATQPFGAPAGAAATTPPAR